MHQIRPPQPPLRPGLAPLIVVFIGPPLVGDIFDRRISECDFFIVLLVSETFLRDVVVSRDDILKRGSTALAAGAPPDAAAKGECNLVRRDRLALPLAHRIGEKPGRSGRHRSGTLRAHSKETRTQARKAAGFRRESGRPKKTGK